jgi:multimeric flavodoxin WrbA
MFQASSLQGDAMKLISLVGSPHGEKGNTAKLTSEVLKGAESLGAVNETIFIKGDTVAACRGCDVCHVKGFCVQKDSFRDIVQKIVDADGLILASPNYIFSVSAQLKAFMDRCCGILHCRTFLGRYGVSVVTSGGGDEKPIADYMNHFLITTGIVPVGSVWATMGLITGDEFPEDIREKAFNLGCRLVKDWQTKAIGSEVKIRMDEFHQRMRSLMNWRKEEWPFEYNYWVRHHNL